VLVVVAYSVVLFFFSSRRRHTRLVSDWSSDVCSSDLTSTAPSSTAVGAAVVLDGAVEVAHGDRDVVDLGDDGVAHALAPLWWRRNRVIWSRCRSRSSGFVTPRPSPGARQSTPTFPSTRL